MGLRIQVVHAGTRQEIDTAFQHLRATGPTRFSSALTPFSPPGTTRHAIPTAFPNRESVEIGGLMSNTLDAWRQSGAHVGRILNGSKPADMPVVQANKFELVINHQTARALDIVVPQSLLVAANAVIEQRC
jgi:ABC transporter substrate binding protein